MSSTDTTTADLTPNPGTPTSQLAAGYLLLATNETVHVLSPELAVPSIRATIQTVTSGIIATLTMPQELFDSGVGPTELNMFASNLELILADSRVSAVTASPELDANDLLADTLTITVAYRPPGSVLPPLTVQTEVPYADVRGTTSLTTGTFSASPVEAAIADAYNRLVALAGG